MTRPKVLIVDDDPAIRSLIRCILKGRAIDIEEADNGGHAIRALQSTAYDAVVLDLMMPAPNGFEVIRFLEENGSGRRVIVVSAARESVVLEQKRSSVVFDVLQKPFDINDLTDKLERCLAVQRSH